jgi:hypothetical protein
MRIITLVAILGAGCVADPNSELGLSATGRAIPPIVFGTSLPNLVLMPAILPQDGGAYSYTPSMPAGANLWKVSTAPGLADGACMDLSNPVFYVHAAPANSPHRNDWILFVPGGGAVQGVDNVVASWFDEPTGGSTHGEMSSLWAPPSISPGGILDPTDVRNPFADWNQVFIHKCSYDRFMGRRASHVESTLVDHLVTGYLPGQQFPVGTRIPFGKQIRFAYRGHDIVDAVVDTLATTTVSYNATTMPSLADANTIMFIGHSGGSRGATMIIDDLAAHLRTVAPGVDVRLVMDAGFDPSAENVVNGATYPATSYPTNDPANGGNPLATAAAAELGFDTVWQADRDATCLANEVDPSVCGDVLHVLMNWVETPMYVRQDLADKNHTTGKDAAGAPLLDCWQVAWDPNANNCYGDTFAHGGAVLDQVADLALLRTNALSHTVLGTTMPRPSGFFPACGFHDGAHTDDGFYSLLMQPNGLTTSYANGLLTWYRFPNVPIRSVEANVPVAIPTGCAYP